MFERLIVPFCLLTGSTLLAQARATVPPACETLPGNAAVSMPLRWSEGAMQVLVEPELLPAGFVGETITGLRLRRSVLPGDGDYAALSRTLTVRAGFAPYAAAQVQGTRTQNRPSNHLVVFGPAPVAVAATPAPAAATTVGDEFVEIVFSQPLPVVAGTLFLEFEAGDGPLSIETDNWVDAVWMENGDDNGLVVVVGDGSCTSRATPTRLERLSGQPVSGADLELQVTGAPPNGLALAWIGLDPEGTAAGTSYTGWGGSFGPADPLMADCYMWAPFELAWFGLADGGGRFAFEFEMPSAAVGLRLGLQAGWLDASRSVVPLSFSNGLQLVCNSAGVQDHCSTMYFPGVAESSPWPAFVGQMPVVILEY